MFLKNLQIRKDDEIIRDIPFRKGINLIVDETSSKQKTSTGNSVGKTTVLRLIDYCLDGNGKNLYIDPEFKTHNHVVESFLKENNVVITAVLVGDLNDEMSEQIKIERNFLTYNKKIQRINNEDLKNDEFSKKLKKLIFKTDSKQPTFKQLKSKNIRDEKNKLINTIRVLAPNVVTDVTYETLHLFWFGIDTNLSKDKLVRDRNIEKRIQTRLRKENNLPQINQALIIINRRIDELVRQKDSFNVNENYEQDFREINVIRQKINRAATEISRLDLRKDLILESKKDLEDSFAEVDTEQIRVLYTKAKILIPNIQKSFEDTLKFHNGMVDMKLKFMTEELPDLEEEIRSKSSIQANLITQEKQLAEKLVKSGAIEDLQTIIEELNSFYEKKGKLDEQKRSWKFSISNIEKIEDDLEKINADLYSKDDLIQERIAEFNVFFSDISSRLDGVHSLLSADNPDGVYKFTIGNIEGNPGTGGKKSQMASFDLAYIQFADSIDLPCLHFILQDQIENVHSNQITNLLTEIVSEVNCQYVLPVLRDKLPKDIDIVSMEILSLSQVSKLFKI
ncbi:MAG: DUF2326 domain-containing protein [Deltaproteobacteria bacterium]|nr:DUF2326 domain-containing protein [Deltaproteobacteria bacterium]